MSRQARERAATETLFAWRRTALQLGAAAVIAARALAQHVGPIVVVASLVAVTLALVVHASASRAYSRATQSDGPVTERALSRLESSHTRLAIVAIGAVIVGLLALTWMVARIPA